MGERDFNNAITIWATKADTPHIRWDHINTATHPVSTSTIGSATTGRFINYNNDIEINCTGIDINKDMLQSIWCESPVVTAFAKIVAQKNENEGCDYVSEDVSSPELDEFLDSFCKESHN